MLNDKNDTNQDINKSRVIFCSKGNHIPDRALVFVYDFDNVLPGYDPIEEPEAVVIDSHGKVIGWETSAYEVSEGFREQAEDDDNTVICSEHLCYCDYREIENAIS